MRLQFVSPHKSITTDVCEDELADFVLLSGPNGSGKSNLLEAIQRGALLVDGVPSAGVGQPNPTARQKSRLRRRERSQR
jgi:AAA15 family ATPase/GTPase